jgi:hypothetical protein
VNEFVRASAIISKANAAAPFTNIAGKARLLPNFMLALQKRVSMLTCHNDSEILYDEWISPRWPFYFEYKYHSPAPNFMDRLHAG